ncbi:diaminopimelate epimerase [Heliorestis acidaminivorans]|uniref:Diaminopimelate epimerase n=1 Tax=Heliorestis acidaminivorans TaxID=553427 RepID=A0A6I0F400_9FIRM|nr:diaminopimelate epimerase [Heliorestis acidaminivorans]KAB2954480.1 diaminopimelate epimerase [Heliorestis acidaminivorans]
MEFVKMHGLGNDFVIVDARKSPYLEHKDWEEVAIKVCDRHYGIGADGLILVLPSEIADISWRIINPDGSEPEMCGNGIRCFARYVYERAIVTNKIIKVETLAGIIVPEIQVNDEGKVVAVKVDMGEPIFERSKIPMTGHADKVIDEEIDVNGNTVKITALSMGNPHCLIYVDKIDQAPLTEWGPLVEKHQIFPKKTNVEFVEILNRNEAHMRVWERGAGPTLACGTGACATLVGSVLNGYLDRQATIHLPGGDLEIEWDEGSNKVFMTGPAVEVFQGNYPLE